MALESIIPGVIGSIFDLFKSDPQVDIAEINAEVAKYGINASKDMNHDNNVTSLKLAKMNNHAMLESSAMYLERADISESRWLDFSYDTAATMQLGCWNGGYPCSSIVPSFF